MIGKPITKHERRSTDVMLFGLGLNFPRILPNCIEAFEEAKHEARDDHWATGDGHSTTWPDRLNLCDTLIWIDLPVWLRTWRVLKRTIRDYGKSRIDLPENCPEQFDLEFYRFIWRTNKRARQNIRSFFESAPSGKSKFKLSNRAEVREFLDKVYAYNHFAKQLGG